MAVEPRFYTVNEVATLLATTPNHVHAMLKRQELPGIKIGNRGQWRVERTEFEKYVKTRYVETAQELAEEAELSDSVDSERY